MPQIHHADIIADMADNCKVMRHKQVCDSGFSLNFFKKVNDLCLNRHIQRRDRLVTDDKLRIARQRACNAKPLALTAAHLMREAMAHRRIKIDGIQQFIDPVYDFLFSMTLSIRANGFLENRKHGIARIQRAIRILKNQLNLSAIWRKFLIAHSGNFFSLIVNFAIRRFIDAQNALARSCLAAARFSYKTERLSLFNAKRHAIHGFHRADRLVEYAFGDGKIHFQVFNAQKFLIFCHDAPPSLTLWQATK